MSPDQKKEKKNTVRNLIIIVTIIVTLVVAVLPFIFPSNDVLATICLGILASIIASLIFSVFSLYVLNDPDHEEEMGEELSICFLPPSPSSFTGAQSGFPFLSHILSLLPHQLTAFSRMFTS